MVPNKKIIALVCLCFAFMTVIGQEKAMTFNIRYNNPDDGENSWENRKRDVVKLLEYYGPGFFGIQEGLFGQLNFIDKELPGYSYVGVGRDDGAQKGEFTAIFYNDEKYKSIKTETFWLSETPNEISVGWDASMERICTYAVFQNKENKSTLYVFNAHFDHIGEKARKMSAKVIRRKIEDLGIQNEPLLVMGDFNSLKEDETIHVFNQFLNDGISKSTKGLYGPKGTFNGFDETLIPKKRIDYIFTKNIKTIVSYRHINDKRNNGLCVSDHLPVLVEFEID